MAQLDENIAVAVTGAHKQYDSSMKVLKGLTMTVRKGKIYGLLGASGCGKTTLLSCIIGKTDLDAGSIKLCVKKRSKLGFMPQELSLFEEFTVEETFFYYGRVYSLPISFIEKQIAFLTSLLQIPKVTRLVSLLSGGQQRRVSFAIALLPSPDILILDEPTVGQDSLLRFSMWEHLLKIADENTTIIITTHYVEEARQANAVGFMYDGVLLEEGNPDELLSRYGCSSLEDVFLHLCHQYTNNKKTYDEPVINEKTLKPFGKKRHLSYSRLLSQWIKNYLYIRKNVMPVIMFLVVLPILEVLILLTCVGNTPYDVPISVVNLEINSSCLTQSYTNDCNKTLGCRFIDKLPDKGLIIKHYANHMIPETVGKNSDRYASIVIPEDFTELVNQRLTLGSSIPDSVLNKSFINILTDTSNSIVAGHVISAITTCFEAALQSWSRDCGWPVSRLIPIKYNEPIYGEKDISYVVFMAPGLLCLFAFLTPLVFSMSALLYEKVTGTMDRSLIAGVLWIEFILAHISVATVFVTIQVITMMYIVFYVYDIYHNGNLILMFFLLILQGFSGMGCGLLVGVIFSSEAGAINFTNGVAFALSFLAGLLWPKEGMHWIAQYLRLINPVTIPVDSVRSIIIYEKSIISFSVAKGFLASAGWTAFFVFVSIIIMQRKNK